MTPAEEIRAALFSNHVSSLRENVLKADPNCDLVRKMDQLVKSFGLKWEGFKWSFDNQKYQWDGKSQTLRGDSVQNILHELGHYQVASPKRRLLKGFGLGSEPDGGNCDSIMAGDYDFREESRASLMGILWVHHIGGEWRKNMDDHEWDEVALTRMGRDETFDETIAWLTKHGILVAGVPQVKIRTHRDHHSHLLRVQ